MTDHLEQGAVIVLDEVVRRATRARASDIHLEPKRDRMNVRFRVDGEMMEEQSVPLDIALEVVSRVKVLARMDIAERRMPQDGQLTLRLEGKVIHLRASSFPSSQGEKLVLRILSGAALIPFEKIGLDAAMQATIREIVGRPQGFLVTSGPTGAGKTSTLYSFMRLVDTKHSNVVTLEDPIEVEVPDITQGQTNVKAGFTFATGLRAILRQDPDVIMVGEIRDSETAGIALQAALTGHLVLSTVHTSDAVDTAVRLVDLGVEPWVVANALTGILAQRLVRVVCRHCQDQVPLDRDIFDDGQVVLQKGTPVIRPRGCDHCMKTGYRGRTGIFEVIRVDDDLRELIKNKASPREYRVFLKAQGMQSLRRVGLEKVKRGETTIDEVLRVTI